MGNSSLEPPTLHGHLFPVSVKGLVFWGNRIPLLLNERDEWELPGGRLELDETPEACACRELKGGIVSGSKRTEARRLLGVCSNSKEACPHCRLPLRYESVSRRLGCEQ